MPYDLSVNFTDSATSENYTTQGALNYLSSISFRLVIDTLKYPNAQFNVQLVALPSISITPAALNTPKRNVFDSPDKVNYDPLELTFLVDEQLANYREIHDWIFGLANEVDTKTDTKERDIQLIILDSNNNVVKEIQFVDAFPTSISSLPFDITQTDVNYLTAAVTFEYSYFKFKQNVI
jgi:hypothetical protein